MDERKEMFEGKQRYAEKVMRANREIETITEEQHDALSELCYMRHLMHSCGERFWNVDKCEYCYGNIDDRPDLLVTSYSQVYIDGNSNLFLDDKESDDTIEINYYPMCGRKIR